MTRDLRPSLLLGAFDAARNAEQDLQKTLKRLYPIGSSVTWKRSHHVQAGTVKAHGYSDLFVINDRTGAEVKIGAFEIVEAHKQARAEAHT